MINNTLVQVWATKEENTQATNRKQIGEERIATKVKVQQETNKTKQKKKFWKTKKEKKKHTNQEGGVRDVREELGATLGKEKKRK